MHSANSRFGMRHSAVVSIAVLALALASTTCGIVGSCCARAAARAVAEGATGAVVLASRSEIKRGEWEQFEGKSFEVRHTGSVAYKLGSVAAGLADATWTLTPKHEWDVAAGVALILSAGGFVSTLDQSPLRFNNRKPKLAGLIAGGDGLKNEILELTRNAKLGQAHR